jgi:hypothetical protein
MNTVKAAQTALREIAGPRLAGDPIKAVIDRLSRQTGLGYSRTYEIWYGRVPRLDPREQLQIAEALEKKRRSVARNELAELRARMARLETLLASTDPDFHCETLTALRNSTLRTD